MTFYSRPDLTAPKFEFSVWKEDLVTPGYMLLTPYSVPPGSNLAAGSVPEGDSACYTMGEILELLESSIQNAPYIYDYKGNLIYSGYGSSGGQYAHDLKLAEYKGKYYLTFFQGIATTINRGHGILMDETYTIVDTVQSGLGRTATDVHEFTVLPNGTAITTIFQPTPYDLTAYGVDQPVGWVLQGIFQEIDMETGEVLFEWNSLDHTTPNESYNGLASNSGAGDGTSVYTAWDYFHMNSVEKDHYGNYLVSSRYLCTVFYISGQDGSIIWRLNGKENDFQMEGFYDDFAFAFQHDVRIHSRNETTMVISMFNDGSDGYDTNMTSPYSSGMIMAVDTSTKVCTMLKEYHLPQYGVSTSQGSVQLLKDSNVFIGWGAQPFVSEYTEDGDCVMVGQFGLNGSAMSYRAFKIPSESWVGQPQSTPALWTYANSTTAPTVFYTSWNGATEIARWRFYGSMNSTGRGIVLGTAEKTGFETTFTANRFWGWGYAEALDVTGAVLGTSPILQTYVPSQM
ncbi:hypothetical protein CFD26_105312 [Aspergillus turcosus]|uniref:ASST-domain-containing protein n=1 Tax=Aspergillus turcosus TaxID=1245748 RepID=A0A421D6N5_9EURO|nr:hypothetical protein CFD26_105312 [Aspergillus turcosus]